VSAHTTWTPELEAALAEPFPDEWGQQRKVGGGRTLTYFPVWRYVQRLNELVGGGWSAGEPVAIVVGGRLTLAVPVTILGVTRTNLGDEDGEVGNVDEAGKPIGYGSAATNAWAQGFKRSCSMFGLSLHLYLEKPGANSAARAEPKAKSPEQRPRIEHELACPGCGEVGSVIDHRSVRAALKAAGKKWEHLENDWTCHCGFGTTTQQYREAISERLVMLVGAGSIVAGSKEHTGLRERVTNAEKYSLKILHGAFEWCGERMEAAEVSGA
jgi:hypothetical protein